MNLKEHRTKINENPDAYSEDLKDDRLIVTMLSHIRKDFPGVRFTAEKKVILKKIVTLIFETQDHRPFFYIEGTELPLCWNMPGQWEWNYIKYEWGHLFV